jgi:hypothetical protein
MELTEEQDSVMTTVYRSTELLPIDQVRVTCPTTVELCGLRLTKKEGKRTRYIELKLVKRVCYPTVSKGQPFQCPSPDGVANGSFSFGEAGLLYTCQKGYQLISDLPDRPIQCHNGKWTSLPPVCKGKSTFMFIQ